MKEQIKNLVLSLVKNDFFWKAVQPFAYLGDFMTRNRKRLEALYGEQNPMEVLNHTSEVLNGPFKGMKYPKLESIGSALYPKLLGSYELEIQYQIEKLMRNKYAEIIDVGCAEGYYAVGMALRCKSSKVFAFDTNKKARQLCLKMAELNGVSERVFVKSEFTADRLLKFVFSGKGLIICDCEGYEKLLFNQDNISNLLNCDLIIETHDFIDIEISTYLKELLKRTHNITSILSTDDIQKALGSKFLELDNLSLNHKRNLLRENRPAIMEWLICIPKVDKDINRQ